MKKKRIIIICSALILMGCRSNITADDIAREFQKGNYIIEQTAEQEESKTFADADVEFAEEKTDVLYESYVLEPKETEKIHIKNTGEEFILDGVSVSINDYKIFDDINDIPNVYKEYGNDLLNKIKNSINADKVLDPETGNYYQNKAWSGRDGEFRSITKINQVLAVEFTVISNSSREVYIVPKGPIGKRDGIDKYVLVGVSEPIRIYSQDYEFDYSDPNQLFCKFDEMGKEYRFTAFLHISTAYGLDFYNELYVSAKDRTRA